MVIVALLIAAGVLATLLFGTVLWLRFLGLADEYIDRPRGYRRRR